MRPNRTATGHVPHAGATHSMRPKRTATGDASHDPPGHSVAGPTTGHPAPTVTGARPTTNRPTAAHATRRIPLAAACQPHVPATIPLPPTRFPVGTARTGSTHLDPRPRGSHGHDDTRRSDGDGRGRYRATHHDDRPPHVATPSARGPAPTVTSARPTTSHPAAAHATRRIPLAAAAKPDIPATVPLPSTRFPIRATGAGSTHLDPRCRRSHPHDQRSRSNAQMSRTRGDRAS